MAAAGNFKLLPPVWLQVFLVRLTAEVDCGELGMNLAVIIKPFKELVVAHHSVVGLVLVEGQNLHNGFVVRCVAELHNASLLVPPIRQKTDRGQSRWLVELKELLIRHLLDNLLNGVVDVECVDVQWVGHRWLALRDGSNRLSTLWGDPCYIAQRYTQQTLCKPLSAGEEAGRPPSPKKLIALWTVVRGSSVRQEDTAPLHDEQAR